MRYSVNVEKPSNTSRKFTVKVPVEEIKSHLESHLVKAQKKSNIKGFRPGLAPIAVVKQYYGDDIRNQVFSQLIDESLSLAIEEQKVRTIGRPKVQAAEEGPLTLNEESDLTYIATFDILPEIQVKGYKGLSLQEEAVAVADDEVTKVVTQFHESQAQLVPLVGGLTLADGTQSVRPVQQGDFADIQMTGGIVGPKGVEYRDDMKGNQLIEVGSGTFIPGFEDQLVGMRKGETKVFQIQFPADYVEKTLADAQAEFTVVLNEVKEKKLAPLDAEFAKQLGYESLDDLQAKARESVFTKKAEDAQRKLRADLFTALIEKNTFEVPDSLIEAEARSLAEGMARDMASQGYPEETIKKVVADGSDRLRANAERQVRVSLLLESVSEAEKLKVTDEDVQKEMARMAESMRLSEEAVRSYYEKNAEPRRDLLFKLRQENAIKFLLSAAQLN